MTELSKTILSDFQVRKKKEQKDAFIAEMQKAYPDMIIEEGGMMKSRNLIVGDVENARVVCGAHYDTCAALPVPNFIAPKNFAFTLFYAILIAVPFLALMVGTELFIMNLTHNLPLAYWSALAVYLVTYLGVLRCGIPNKHTANDNTSGVITLIELIAQCREKGISDVAFVFFDHEETGLHGSAFFRKKHKEKMKHTLLLNFDCVSDGDHMLFVLNKTAKEAYEEALRASVPAESTKLPYFESASTTFYPSDQRGFPISIAVSAMKKKRFLGLYLDRIHTKRDTVMDETNIAFLTEMMEKFFDFSEKSQ